MRFNIQRVQRAGQLLALIVAGLLTAATSAGEANDEESTPGGNDPGGEQTIGDGEVDFSEVETPTEVVVGGNDFALTGDGRYILAVRAVWYGGGDEIPEIRSRKLFALDTTLGGVTSGLDLRESGEFGVVMLQDPRQVVVVHRNEAGTITRLEGVGLPDFEVQWTYTPPVGANTVRLSPSGRFLALWQTHDEWIWNSAVDQLTVTIHDRQTGLTAAFNDTDALADVVAEPDSSAFYVAISRRNHEAYEQSSLRMIRVDLATGFPFQEVIIAAAGHASDLEIRGGSSLRLNPQSRTLIFAGCTFESATCNARMYVLDADTLDLRGDLRGAGAAVFDPTGNRALGWDGASNDIGKIWVTECQDPNLDPDDYYYVDHWLLSVNTETLDSSIIELPRLAPYYFMTRDGAYTVASVENCDDHQLYAVEMATGDSTPIEFGDHALHHFTVLDDHRSIYSVDRGLLERIDLNTLTATPAGLAQYVARINRLPDSTRLVLADPDLLTFTLYETSSDTIIRSVNIDDTPSPPPPPSPLPSSLPTPGAAPSQDPETASTLPQLAPQPRRVRAIRTTTRSLRSDRSSRSVRSNRAQRHAPRLAQPRLPGKRLGQEQSL
jgi:hypothetical protein